MKCFVSVKKSIVLSALTALFMVVPSHSVNAADSDGFSRDKGMIVRIGAGIPSNFNMGAGYRFCPHFSVDAELFSYSGLTTFTGAVDARYYILDKSLTPFIAAKIGYGTLGKTMEYSTYRNALGSLTAGISWRRFDLGAGIIYDPFHRVEFTANLSFTYCFKRKHLTEKYRQKDR